MTVNIHRRPDHVYARLSAEFRIYNMFYLLGTYALYLSIYYALLRLIEYFYKFHVHSPAV